MSPRVLAYTQNDMTISVNGTIMLLIEMINGKTGGEVYMQACRGYKIATEALVEKNTNLLACGAPTFLLCLNSESVPSPNRRWNADIIYTNADLRISGAFKDGERVVGDRTALIPPLVSRIS